MLKTLNSLIESNYSEQHKICFSESDSYPDFERKTLFILSKRPEVIEENGKYQLIFDLETNNYFVEEDYDSPHEIERDEDMPRFQNLNTHIIHTNEDMIYFLIKAFKLEKLNKEDIIIKIYSDRHIFSKLPFMEFNIKNFKKPSKITQALNVAKETLLQYLKFNPEFPEALFYKENYYQLNWQENKHLLTNKDELIFNFEYNEVVHKDKEYFARNKEDILTIIYASALEIPSFALPILALRFNQLTINLIIDGIEEEKIKFSF